MLAVLLCAVLCSVMSVVQALVLLLFNDCDELTAEAIKEQLGVDDDKELQRTLLSLSVGKVRGGGAQGGRYMWEQKCVLGTCKPGPRKQTAQQRVWLARAKICSHIVPLGQQRVCMSAGVRVCVFEIKVGCMYVCACM